MSGSDFSFLDDSEFNFASDHDSEGDNKSSKNDIKIKLFHQDVEDQTELCGFIFISIGQSIQEGRIYLRLESTEETNLPVINSSETLMDGIKKISPRMKNQKIKKRYIKKKNLVKPKRITPMSIRNISSQHANNHFFANIRNKEHELTKSIGKKSYNGREGLDDSSREIDAQKEVNYLEDQKGINQTQIRDHEISVMKYLAKSKISTNVLLKNAKSELFTCDISIFTISDPIQKKIYLTLPFKIKLDQRVVITHQHNFMLGTRPNELKYLSNGFLHGPSVTDDFGINSRKSFSLDENSSLELKEYIKINHTVKAYYITKSAYNQSKKLPERDSYNFFKGYDSFMESSADFRLRPNYKAYKLKKIKHEKDVVIGHVNGCFSKKEIKTKIKISIDKNVIRSQEKNLNFVLNFSDQLIKYYSNLDVYIKSKLEIHSEIEEESKFLEKISLMDNFDLTSKVPFRHFSDEMEFVKKIDLASLYYPMETINAEKSKLTHYIAFYLSKEPFEYEVKIMEEELIFVTNPSNFEIIDKSILRQKFRKLENRLVGHKKDNLDMVTLPFTKINLCEFDSTTSKV